MIRLTHANLANDSKINSWVSDNLAPMLTRTRQDRRILEDRWQLFWKIWNLDLEGQSYVGRARTYLPAGRNALETWVMATMQGLFPMSEWFGVDAVEGIGTKAAARSWKNMQRHFLNKTMQLKLHMPLFLRQYYTLGTGVFKQIWEEEVERLRFFERVLMEAGDTDPEDDSLTVIRDEDIEDTDFEEDPLEFQIEDGTKVRLVERDVKTKVGPTVRVVDLFHFYVFPNTSPSIQEAELVFEDTETTIEHIQRVNKMFMDPEHEDMGRVYDNIKEIVQGGGKLLPEYLISRVERQQKFWGEFNPCEQYGKLSKGHVNLTECYWRGEIPDAKDPLTGEEYGEQDWLIVMVNDTWPIRIHPNPFYTKKRPYKDARFLRVVDEFYGRGVTEAMASMQYMLNDVNNLTLDNITNTLNPIILINEDLVTQVESLRLAPNAKWFVDPEGVKFITPPNVAQVGMATINMMQGFIQDASGANFISQGRSAPMGRGRAQNSAAGMGLLLQQGSQGFQFALTELEEQLMIPMLEWNYQLAEQFMTEKLPLLVGGEQNMPLLQEHVGFEDIFGSYRYTWKGSQGVKEQMALTQQMQQFIQMALQIRTADPQAQFQVKWSEVLRSFITKGMGLPNADEWIMLPDEPPAKSPELVLAMLKSHRPVEAGVNENHEQSIKYLIAAGETDPQFRIDPIARGMLEDLMKQHVDAIMQERAAQEQAMVQAALQAAANGGPPGLGGPGGPPGGPAGLSAMGVGPQAPPSPMDMNADIQRSMAQT